MREPDDQGSRADHAGRDSPHGLREPLAISQNRLAQATGLSQTRVGVLVNCKRGITAETGLRLSRTVGIDRLRINARADSDIEGELDSQGRI